MITTRKMRAVLSFASTIFLLLTAICFTGCSSQVGSSTVGDDGSTPAKELTHEVSDELSSFVSEVESVGSDVGDEIAQSIESGAKRDSILDFVNKTRMYAYANADYFNDILGGKHYLSYEGKQLEEFRTAGYSEGYCIAVWETSEYDEKWETEYNHKKHGAIFDKDGKVVADLESLFRDKDKGVESEYPLVDVQNFGRFSEGLAAIMFSWYPEDSDTVSYTVHVVNTSGDVVFSFGSGDSFFDDKFIKGQDPFAFAYGLLQASPSVFLNKEGEVALNSQDFGYEYATCVAENTFSFGHGGTSTRLHYASSQGAAFSEYERFYFDAEGNHVFDCADLLTDAYTEVSCSSIGGGVLSVRLEEENPHSKGHWKTYLAVYSMPLKKYIIEPKEFDGGIGESDYPSPIRNGVFAINARYFNDDNSDSYGTYLFTTEGNPVCWIEGIPQYYQDGFYKDSDDFIWIDDDGAVIALGESYTRDKDYQERNGIVDPYFENEVSPFDGSPLNVELVELAELQGAQ